MGQMDLQFLHYSFGSFLLNGDALLMATFKDQVSRLNTYPTPTSFKFWGTNGNLSVGTALDMLFTAQNNAGGLVTVSSTAGGILPSATSATYGTAFNVVAPNPVSTYGSAGEGSAANAATFQVVGVSGIVPLQITFTATVIGTETLTYQVTATYNDATTTSINSKTATTTAATSYAIADMTSLLANGKYITNLALEVKSSISSSTATVTGVVYGFSQLCNVQFPAFV